MMLNRNGLNYTPQSSMPIPIPVSKKLENDTLVKYEDYNNSIPKYGSAESSVPSILTQKNNSLYNNALNPLIFQINLLENHLLIKNI